MHDVERQFLVIAAGDVHTHLLRGITVYLGGEIAGFAHYHYAALAELEGDALGPARGGSLLVLADVDRRIGGSFKKINAPPAVLSAIGR